MPLITEHEMLRLLSSMGSSVHLVLEFLEVEKMFLD